MADKTKKDATRKFGLGRAGTGPVESTEGRDGHPLAMVADYCRHHLHPGRNPRGRIHD